MVGGKMNREVTSSLWPLSGDVSSQAGSDIVTVIGLQGIPIKQIFLQGGEEIMFDINSNQWIPTLRAIVQVNNVTVSNDAYVSVNVLKPILVNGS
jgi:hypothetical protein